MRVMPACRLTAIGAARDELITWRRYGECLAAVEAALRQASDAEPTAEAAEELGAGWVAEEALATALFCALKAQDFVHGIRLAVNHSGDSDSTAAITGNILGALWGRLAIPEEFLETLELRSVIEELSLDLSGWGAEEDYRKYPPW